MNHYKIVRGYNAEDYIEIDETELEKALYAFLEKKDGVYSGGAVKGSEIIAIQPDYHKTMDWNRGHKLDDFDFAELKQKGIDKKLQLTLSETKARVQYLISSGQENLIGKNLEVPRLESNKEVSEEVKKLSDKFKA